MGGLYDLTEQWSDMSQEAVLVDGLVQEGYVFWSNVGVLVEVLTVNLSKATEDEDAELADEEEEDTEDDGDVDGVETCLSICALEDGKTKAMSPLGNLVGTSWSPAVLGPVLKKIPL